MPGGDAEQFGNRGDGAAGVGQQVAGGADVFLRGDRGASADSAAGAGGSQALLGADDDEFADELRQRRKDVEDESAAGGGGVQVLVQRGEADASLTQLGDHVDEVLETATVAVERGDHERVARVEEDMTRLQLGAEPLGADSDQDDGT